MPNTTTYNFPQNVYLLQLVKDVIQSYILEQHPQWPTVKYCMEDGKIGWPVAHALRG